ncbi:MAG: hydrogenase [Planctomycetota bacterium]|nr:MAG: hydrogenase [Planctomycetota bacterium]
MDPTLLQRVSLDVARARSSTKVLDRIVAGIEQQDGVALARIWLIGPGDQCRTCAVAPTCPERTRCLHLLASSGGSQLPGALRWDTLDGRFRRLPLGKRKVGRIGQTGRPVLLHIDAGDDWLADPAWARAEGIRSFAGQPLMFRDEVLGVLAVFSRADIEQECFGWLRTFADQAAVAIANARAFEQVERLRTQLELERDYLREEFDLARSHRGLVGDSPAMVEIQRQIAMVAPTEAPVLILGESGTGKELIATAIHEASARASAPMVRVNCASIPAELFESEFFGHKRGAFTGATGDRAGRFLVADGGTLLLDEVGEIPLELQGKLLRALQEGQFSAVGSDQVQSVDVRVLASTNRDLRAEVDAGRFREDLYYRLAVFPLEVPPLRQRRGDIPALAQHVLKLVASRRNGPSPVLRKRDVAALVAYDWPGNVRELQNVIERAAILGSSDRLALELLPGSAGSASDSGLGAAGAGSAGGSDHDTDRDGEPIPTEADRSAAFVRDIQRALQRAGGRVSGAGGAAELLGLRPTTLTSRMKTLGIERPR